jgi:hypothetical protein
VLAVSGAGSVLTFFTALLGYLSTRKKVNALSVQLDGNLSRLMDKLGVERDRSGQLADTLKDAGVAVPPKPDPPSSASGPS